MVPVSAAYTDSPAVTSYGNIIDRRRNGGDATSSLSQNETIAKTTQPSESIQKTDRQIGIQISGTDSREFIPYGPDGRLEGKKQTSGTPNPNNTQAATSGKDTEDDPQTRQEISRLQAIDTKVKAHEAAHKAAGGTITGPVSYTYTRGPDGKNYATAGEVPINISPGRTPRETVERMEQVIRSALAPSDPSPQDRAVAAQAAAIEQQALQENGGSTDADTDSSPADKSGKTTGTVSNRNESNGDLAVYIRNASSFSEIDSSGRTDFSAMEHLSLYA